MVQENAVLHVGDRDFEKTILKASLPAMVDFWAPWCGPCQIVAPLVEELAREYAGRVLIAKVNTDEHQEWAGRLGIRGIPTLIFFKNGIEVDRIIGAVPKKVLRERLEALL